VVKNQQVLGLIILEIVASPYLPKRIGGITNG